MLTAAWTISGWRSFGLSRSWPAFDGKFRQCVVFISNGEFGIDNSIWWDPRYDGSSKLSFGHYPEHGWIWWRWPIRYPKQPTGDGGWTGPDYRIPLWMPFIPLFAATVLLFRLDRRGFGSGRCQHCGYDLRASRERCPECGAAVSEAADVNSGCETTDAHR